MNTTPMTEFPTGARRGTDHLDCDVSLIPPEAIRAWGRAFAEGKQKYGRDNWLKGFPQMGIINHALQHIFSYLEGDKSEDHLGHAMWNIGVAIHQQAHRPDLLDLPPYQKLQEPPTPPTPTPAKTAEDLVKEVYPKAICLQIGRGNYCIDADTRDGEYNWISDDRTATFAAWQSALDRINAEKSKS